MLRVSGALFLPYMAALNEPGVFLVNVLPSADKVSVPSAQPAIL